MPYEVRYSEKAVEDLKRMRRFDRSAVIDQIDQVLAVNPALESKARVKKLREPAPAQYRLRVGEFRVFYDVAEDHLDIIMILSKEDAVAYLEGEFGGFTED
jgi:mRNA-degrading endonuclease RelE of RelBE toxin-antitoxin system